CVIGHLRADEVAQRLLGNWVALVLEDFQRKGDVVGGERTAIVERDAGPHQETISQSIGRYLHRARSEAVQRVGLILGPRDQAREGELHPHGGIAPEDEAVEKNLPAAALLKMAVERLACAMLILLRALLGSANASIPSGLPQGLAGCQTEHGPVGGLIAHRGGSPH